MPRDQFDSPADRGSRGFLIDTLRRFLGTINGPLAGVPGDDDGACGDDGGMVPSAAAAVLCTCSHEAGDSAMCPLHHAPVLIASTLVIDRRCLVSRPGP